MTREEAIRLLDLNREYLKNTNNIGLKDDIEALDMAIKALEQEPCEDTISRQAVMDAIAETIVYGEELGYSVAHGIVDDLPSVTPKTDILDKIRAEVEHLAYYCCEVHPKTVIDDVLDIIDKYAESEE